MSLFQGLIIGGIVLLLLVSAVHSWLGEKLLIKPMFSRRGNAVLESDLARRVIRYAWHATSLMWLMMAIMLYAVGFAAETLGITVLLTLGVGFLLSGIIDWIVTRGRHIGWWILTAIGVCCLGAYFVAGTSL